MSEAKEISCYLCEFSSRVDSSSASSALVASMAGIDSLLDSPPLEVSEAYENDSGQELTYSDLARFLLESLL